MKIGVISDTHIPDRAGGIPAKVLEEFKNVDMIIHAGDLVETGVLDVLRSVCPNVSAVWGNMDPDEIKNVLPEKVVLRIGKFRIGVIHGYGVPNKLIDLVQSVFECDNVNIIIFGHSHNSVNEKRNGILFFNPGSPTDKVFSEHNSYGIIEINDGIEAKIIKI